MFVCNLCSNFKTIFRYLHHHPNMAIFYGKINLYIRINAGWLISPIRIFLKINITIFIFYTRKINNGFLVYIFVSSIHF